jgi:hypothetical protein
MRLSQAELELIETVRHWDAKNFTLTIRVDKGRWDASLADHDRDLVATGTGSDFNSAWNDIIDPRLRWSLMDTRFSPPLSLSDIEGSARRDQHSAAPGVMPQRLPAWKMGSACISLFADPPKRRHGRAGATDTA